MSKELLDANALQPFKGDEIRQKIADRIKFLRAKFRMIPLQIQRYNIRLSEDLANKWKEENR